MSKRLPTLFSLLLLIMLQAASVFNAVQASTAVENAQLSQRLMLHSAVLNEERQVQVVLPENYFSNPTATYPVLYLLDGDYVVHGVSGMLDFLANKAQMIPDVIIVGIADKGTGKYREYMSPLPTNVKADSVDKAALFLTFLQNELKPFINKQFRTANNSILAGQSIGGLFVFNALLESPEAFDHYIAVSPAIWWDEHAIMEKAKATIGKKQHARKSLYLSLGDETRQGVYAVMELLDQRPNSSIDWQFDHYPEENHNSVGILAIRQNLKAIFNQWTLSDKALERMGEPNKLIAHYQDLTEKFAIKQAIPTASVKSAIRYFYRNEQTEKVPAFVASATKKLPASEEAFIKMYASYIGYFDKPEKALALLLKSESRFNHSIDYIKTIASTYEQTKNTQQAKVYYQKALKLAQQQDANQWLLNIIDAKLVALN